MARACVPGRGDEASGLTGIAPPAKGAGAVPSALPPEGDGGLGERPSAAGGAGGPRLDPPARGCAPPGPPGAPLCAGAGGKARSAPSGALHTACARQPHCSGAEWSARTTSAAVTVTPLRLMPRSSIAPLQIEMRVASVVGRRYQPERVPALLARPQLRHLGRLSLRPDIGRHFMHGRRSTRGAFLLGTDGDVFSHAQLPFRPRVRTCRGRAGTRSVAGGEMLAAAAVT
jgi:hypothetical protein